MFQPQHCGLYFTDVHIQRARTQANSEPFQSAWTLLNQGRQLDLLALAQWQALRYRLAGDEDAGARAVRILEQADPSPTTAGSLVEAAASLITWAQSFEMVRDHPAFAHPLVWLERFAEAANHLDAQVDGLQVDQLWLNALNLAASVVLEQEAPFMQAVERFKETIRHEVHPEGYLRLAAEGPRGESLMRMLLSAQALILTAEIGLHAGEDLWAFNERRVSALTPTPYLLYYYYYPEKWRWDSELRDDQVPEISSGGLDLGAVQVLYRRHAGIWEMAQHRAWSKDRQVLLDEIRPVYDLWGGGLVTLTHGTSEVRRKRFGLFG